MGRELNTGGPRAPSKPAWDSVLFSRQVERLDFARVFDEVASFLEARGHRVAVVGGLAILAHGSSRATFDLDLLTEAGAREELVAFLEKSGYETLHASPGFSNHSHGESARGRVDVVYVDAATARSLFEGASPGLSLGSRRALVPRPEHLIAMKVRAMKNDPTRALGDLADIQFLLRLPGVDRDEARSYFVRAGMEGRFDELVRSL
jgi:hypothetical protein